MGQTLDKDKLLSFEASVREALSPGISVGKKGLNDPPIDKEL